MDWIFYLIICICVLVIVSLFLYFFQEKFIFIKGKKLNRNYQYKFSNQFKEVFIKTNGDNELNALHFKLENPKGIIVFCHGNKGNLKRWGNRVSYLLKYNYEVLVYDYRSYGKSTGDFKEVEMYNDALLVYNYANNFFKEKDIVVYGFSLGGTFATKIAAENSPKALILEAPFYNFKKAVKYYAKLAPTFLLRYKFRSDLEIPKVKSPITIFHGNEDKTTSFKDSKRLIMLNKNSKNQFIKIDKGTHHNIKEFEKYQQKLKEILER